MFRRTVQDYWLPTRFASFSLHFPTRASPCVISFWARYPARLENGPCLVISGQRNYELCIKTVCNKTARRRDVIPKLRIFQNILGRHGARVNVILFFGRYKSAGFHAPVFSILANARWRHVQILYLTPNFNRIREELWEVRIQMDLHPLSNVWLSLRQFSVTFHPLNRFLLTAPRGP